MSDQLTLQLPYEEITALATRDYLRQNFTRSSKEVYKIPFEKLEIREGFNKRLSYDHIEELADSLAAKGLDVPLDVDILPDGRIFIEKGHRRYMAIKFNRERGIIWDTIDCYPNPKTKTELERMEDVYNSNQYSQKLKPIEQANVIWDLKNNFGKVSNESISERLGISRQKVDYLLLIASASDDLKNEILKGDMGLADAVAFLRKQKQAVKQSDKAELNSHKNSDAATPLPKDMLADEVKELAKLDEQAEDLKKDDDGEEPETTEEVRMTNPEAPEYKGKELKLVGNTAAVNEKPESEIPGAKKFDEQRNEIKQVQNIIRNADKIEAIVNKLDVPEGTKTDIANLVKWMQKDLEELRDWIHSNKKENKRGR